MKVRDITSYLESIAPLDYQESYDNSGLIVGDPAMEVTAAIVSLDCTEEIVDEAIARGANMVISHHPIVFRGLKKFNGKNYVERTVIKAIEHKIALYAIHTNLDNVLGGVNTKIASKLGLENISILAPKGECLKKLSVHVPRSAVDAVRDALFAAGAGAIGGYDECSFNQAGYGTFRPREGANPTIGEVGVQERVEETKIEVVFPAFLERKVLVAMFSSHPYEEVAYQVVRLDNTLQSVGAGAIGNLSELMSGEEFLRHLKQALGLNIVRHTALLGRPISRVAVCGGAGSFLLADAIRSGADVFVTADFKYHEFFDAEDKTIVADIGHFESERFTQELLLEIIQKKFPNFAVRLTELDTNPIKYFYS